MSASANALDALLLGVIRDHRERVLAWMDDVPGSWGFLAGQAVLACRDRKGDALSDAERRIIWHRLWQLLTELKQQATDQEPSP